MEGVGSENHIKLTTYSTEYRYRIQNVECRMQNPECRIQNTEHRTQNTKHKKGNLKKHDFNLFFFLKINNFGPFNSSTILVQNHKRTDEWTDIRRSNPEAQL